MYGWMSGWKDGRTGIRAGVRADGRMDGRTEDGMEMGWRWDGDGIEWNGRLEMGILEGVVDGTAHFQILGMAPLDCHLQKKHYNYNLNKTGLA